AAVGDEHLLGRDRDTGVAAGLLGDRGAQLGLAGTGGVPVVARVAAGRRGRLDDVVGRREVGLAGAEADDRLAGGLERLRLRVDREGGRRRDRRDPLGDPGRDALVAAGGVHGPDATAAP